MDICELLRRDHAEAVGLAKQVTQAEDVLHAKDLYRALRLALTAHARAEESVVYAAIDQLGLATSAPGIRENEVEHSLCDHLLAKMTRGRPDHPGWRARAVVIHDLLVRHVDNEHRTLLRQIDEQFTPAQRDALGLRFAARKATLLRQRT